MIVDRPTMIGAVVLDGGAVVLAVPFSAVLLLAVGGTTVSGMPLPEGASDPARGRGGLNAGRVLEACDSDDLVGDTTSWETPPVEPT